MHLNVILFSDRFSLFHCLALDFFRISSYVAPSSIPPSILHQYLLHQYHFREPVANSVIEIWQHLEKDS